MVGCRRYVHPKYNFTLQYGLTIAFGGPSQTDDSRLSWMAERRHSILFWLTSAFGSSATLGSSRLWFVEVSRRDPALVVRFSTRSDRWAIGTNDRNLISRIDLPGLPGRSFSSFATLSSTTLLGKQGSNPCAVDEVASAAECREQE